MKFILGISVCILLISCSKLKSDTMKGRIERDCTGSYIEIGTKDYLVANPSMIDHKEEGKVVKVIYRDAKEGDYEYEIVCFLHHPYESAIYIEKVLN